jgi:tetratricopeptide (TPR) repeat protein
VYYEAGNIQEAMTRFLKAVQYKPDYADALMNLGSCYGMMGQYDLAIQYFDKCIAVDPSKAQAWYFAGITWRNKGDEGKAAYYLGQFERLNGQK